MKNGAIVLQTAGLQYDLAGRLGKVFDGNVAAAYGYLPNSMLVSTVGLTNGPGTGQGLGVSRMYDAINRLTTISSRPYGTLAPGLPVSFAYQYNTANQRTKATLEDASFWVYQFDSLSQVISGTRSWANGTPNGTPVSGQSFTYAFDDIGNRDQTGGRASALSDYTANRLNQYTSRTNAGSVDVVGLANAAFDVTVNGVPAAGRVEEYFHHPLSVPNASAQYQAVTVAANEGTISETGSVFVPPATETFGYDTDGNLTSDGRWTYTWDGENRLVQMIRDTDSPIGARQKLAFEYDWQGRRIRKQYFTYSGGWVEQVDTIYLYDGWNLLSELNANASNARVRTYVWGTDLSGSLQGAGGVGGLLKVTCYGTTTTNAFVAYDGNGNVTALVDAANGSVVAGYEYGPFGEPIRVSGSMGKANPIRFSSKYGDDESDLVYYGYRYYNASTGRWPNRDPIGEPGGVNLHCLVGNNPVTHFDPQGLTDWGDVIPGWWDTAWNTFDWATGHSGSTDYGPESLQSRQMSQSSIAGQIRDAFLKKNRDKLCKDWKGISTVGTKFRVFHELIFDAFNGTAEFVGRASGDVVARKDLVNCKIKAEFHLMNTTSLRSLLYGKWPEWLNVTLPGLPAANWAQFYVWNETFDCKCCR